MEMNRIVLNNVDKLTSDEKDLLMLSALEKEFNTGPIIGEARALILRLSRNIQIRDLLMSVSGLDDNRREELFLAVTKMMDERDAEILAEREAVKKVTDEK